MSDDKKLPIFDPKKLLLVDGYKMPHYKFNQIPTITGGMEAGKLYLFPHIESETPKIVVIGDISGGNIREMQSTLQHGIFLFGDKDVAAEVTENGKIILRKMMNKIDFNDLIIKKDNEDGL